MKFISIAVLLLFCTLWLDARTRVGVFPPAPLSVTELPPLFEQLFCDGPQMRRFRCINRTASPQQLRIIAEPLWKKGNLQIISNIEVPKMSSSDVSMLLPCVSDNSSLPRISVESVSGVEVAFTPYRSSRGYIANPPGMASASFKPDFFEYLLEGDFQKSPLPVREWPTASIAYAGIPVIVLDSNDVLPEMVRQALRLAAARGTRILVLVMGNAPWPSYAGFEMKGLPFEEKIGFGSWVVMRSSATEKDPRWKDFVKRKHAAEQKGKYSRTYTKLKWHENALYKYLNRKDPLTPWAMKVQMPQPPIPMGRLTFVMICFVIIIGPVNFLVLKRYRRTLWAVVTTPLISLIFTGAVIASVIFGEGIRSKGRGEVETILDQRNGIAATRGAFGIYAPLSVGDFRFTPEDVLYFYKPGKVRGEFRDNEYVYASSLVRPRMSFSYALCRAEERSEKIAVTEKNGHVEIVNGLGVKVDTLYLRDGKNQLFKLDSPLVPGARAVLRLIPKLPAQVQDVEKNCYRATLSEPLFISPGVAIDQYEHNQSLYGRWR